MAMVSSPRLDILAAVLMGSFYYCIQVWLYIDIPLTYKATYAFSVRSSGAVFIAMGCGMVAGLLVFGLLSEKIMARLARGQDRQPEHRLPLMAGSILVFTLGITVYTLATKLALFWLVPALGNAVMGMGLFSITMSISAFVLDSSPQQAVAFAALLSVARFSSGALFPVLAHKIESLTSPEAFKWGLATVSSVMMAGILAWIRVLLMPKRAQMSWERRGSASSFS